MDQIVERDEILKNQEDLLIFQNKRNLEIENLLTLERKK